MVLPPSSHNNIWVYVCTQLGGGDKQWWKEEKMVGVLFTTLSPLVFLSITVTRQPTQQLGKSWQA